MTDLWLSALVVSLVEEARDLCDAGVDDDAVDPAKLGEPRFLRMSAQEAVSAVRGRRTLKECNQGSTCKECELLVPVGHVACQSDSLSAGKSERVCPCKRESVPATGTSRAEARLRRDATGGRELVCSPAGRFDLGHNQVDVCL